MAENVESAQTAVLIVGAGPVGLALAGDLGWRGIDCLLIEATDGTIYQPRMDLVGPRTMEFCRRWDIVEDVENAPYPRDYPQDNIYLTSMTGYELGREPMPSMAGTAPLEQSPQNRERCPQNMFDPILREFALRQAATTVRYNAEMMDFSQDEDGVVAEVRDGSGFVSRVKAQYLVGCDGGRSQIRERLGIGMSGAGTLTYTTNIIFRCPDFVELHGKDPGYRYILVGPEGTWATIVAINGRDQWRMSIVSQGERRELSETEIHAAIEKAMGKPFAYEILSVMPWVRRELVADQYRKGRVFLCGDAVHVMSPTGGFGMNTGIADAVDLSWKLAAVIEGWGGEALLDSYEIERRPVALRNVKEASRNLKRMLSPGKNPELLDETPEGERVRKEVGAAFSEAMRHEWHTLGIHLGYRYDASPVCASEDGEGHEIAPDRYVQSAAPGARAPHVWLDDGRSTLDLFGRGFVLLRIGSEAPEADTLIEAFGARGVPVDHHHLCDAGVHKAYRDLLVLVRPDGHVAWRGNAAPEEPMAVVDLVRGSRPDRMEDSEAGQAQTAAAMR